MSIVGQQRVSFIDYPELISTVFFVPYCNFYCPYCHNVSLLKDKQEELSFDTIRAFFKKKKPGMIEGVVISGGEPTIQKDIKEIVDFFNTEIKLKLKLDTNGARPEVVDELQVDYVAIDFKTDKNTYKKLTTIKNIYDDILETFNVLTVRKTLYEIRITAVPGFIDIEKLKSMTKDMPKGAQVRLQKFNNTNCLDPLMKDVKPYSEEEMEELRKLLRGLGFRLL